MIKKHKEDICGSRKKNKKHTWVVTMCPKHTQHTVVTTVALTSKNLPLQSSHFKMFQFKWVWMKYITALMPKTTIHSPQVKALTGVRVMQWACLISDLFILGTFCTQCCRKIKLHNEDFFFCLLDRKIFLTVSLSCRNSLNLVSGRTVRHGTASRSPVSFLMLWWVALKNVTDSQRLRQQ